MQTDGDSSSIYSHLENFDVEEKKIGQGQFSVVHRAVCKPDGRSVALKKIQVAIAMHPHADLSCSK